jgi:hypothetical protein
MRKIQEITVRAVSTSAAIALLAGMGAISLHAQSATAPAAGGSNLFTAALTPTIDLANLSYSSSVGAEESSSIAAAAPDAALATDAAQPPPRRRYGRPRYNDSSHNADGSNKWGFIAGGGLTIPLGNTHKYYTPSWDIQVGGGRNWSSKFSTMVEFNYHNFGAQASTINNQSILYFGDTQEGLDANAHVWSFTVDPSYSFWSTDTLGAYVVGGAGFYHKVTNFTLPSTGEYCSYYGCYQYTANQNVDHYTSNAVGVNAGFGMTYKFSRFANERFYAEARYVFIPNSHKDGVTAANEATYTGTNLFPANSNKTTFVPITVGVRF